MSRPTDPGFDDRDDYTTDLASAAASAAEHTLVDRYPDYAEPDREDNP